MDKQDINKRILEFQQGTVFPDGDLTNQFIEVAKKSLLFHSPASLRMPVPDYKNLCIKTSEFTMYEVGLLLRIVEQRSANDLGMDAIDYCEFQEYLIDLATTWRSIEEPKEQSLKREFEAKQNMEQKNSGRTIEMSKPN